MLRDMDYFRDCFLIPWLFHIFRKVAYQSSKSKAVHDKFTYYPSWKQGNSSMRCLIQPFGWLFSHSTWCSLVPCNVDECDSRYERRDLWTMPLCLAVAGVAFSAAVLSCGIQTQWLERWLWLFRFWTVIFIHQAFAFRLWQMCLIFFAHSSQKQSTAKQGAALIRTSNNNVTPTM